MVLKQSSSRVCWMQVDFKGAHYPKSVILNAVYFYVRYGVSYRDMEKIMAERGAEVDHARKRPTSVSWRMDETKIKVKEGGPIITEPSTRLAKPLTLCSPSAATMQPRGDFSSWQLVPMACRIGSSSTRSAPIWRVWKASTSS